MSLHVPYLRVIQGSGRVRKESYCKIIKILACRKCGAMVNLLDSFSLMEINEDRDTLL